MRTRIGTCSLCGGNVEAETGPWLCITPPPPARCTSCGAVEKGSVIEMVPSIPQQTWISETTYAPPPSLVGDAKK